MYPVVQAAKPAFASGSAGVTYPEGSTTRDLPLQIERDFSSDDGSASVRAYTGPDNTNQGCGPRGAVDDSLSTVWGTSRATGGQRLDIDMGVPIDLGRIRIDPSAGCGDDDNAALGQYEILGSTGPDGPFTAIKAGTLTAANNGKLNEVFTGTVQGVRYLRLRAIAPQSSNGDGAQYIDVTELHVGRSPGSLLGPSITTGGMSAVGTVGATATGTVTPHDQPAQVVVEYGTSTSYGTTTAPVSFAAGSVARPVVAALGGLTPGTTYHYRAVAIVGADRYPGADATFTTKTIQAPPPQPTPTPTPTPTPPKPPAPPPPPTATKLLDGKLKANRKGNLTIGIGFGNKAPTTGPATLRIVGRRNKVIARTFVDVSPGKTVIKHLRLSRRGRAQIPRGKTKQVRLVLSLPDGAKISRTLRLARAKR